MTKVELSISGRGASDAPLVTDLIEQIQDLLSMMEGVAASVAGDAVPRFDWRVVGLSKQSPAKVILEAEPRPGHADGDKIAAQARDFTTEGLRALIEGDVRPLHFTDNVIEAADRFVKRITRGLVETRVGDGAGHDVAIGQMDAVSSIKHISSVREEDPIHPYTELGSIEGRIENVGADGYGRPYIVVKHRISGKDVRCFLSGDALRDLEQEPVAKVVWRERKVVAVGVLSYRAVGKISRADVSRLEFIDPSEKLPQLADIIDYDFTSGLTSEEYLERLRNGEA